MFLCREGVAPRKRKSDVAKEQENAVAEAEERASVCQRVKGLFEVFEPVPEAQQWLDSFKQEQDRYPFLVVLGPSRSRQTERAKPFFQNPLQLDVGALETFLMG